jgi:hypothetical protein
VEPEETFIARQRLGKHICIATTTQATIMFSVCSVKSGNKRGELVNWSSVSLKQRSYFRVEVGSNISTVALRVVGGDENETQCLEV